MSDKDLTNLITLKSELDLVRGQNEQLRSEMKALRIERKNLLSYCTQHILGENEAKKKSSSEEESNNNNVGDDELDMSEGEVIPSSLMEPKVDQDTADAISDDVRITKEEILGRGIKLVISEVLNESNDNEDENGFERDHSRTERDEEEKSDISHETQHESGQEITRNTIVIREKVPCTKCPKAFSALEEILKRMNKIISIIKQREQDKKLITTNAQQVTMTKNHIPLILNTISLVVLFQNLCSSKTCIKKCESYSTQFFWNSFQFVFHFFFEIESSIHVILIDLKEMRVKFFPYFRSEFFPYFRSEFSPYFRSEFFYVTRTFF